MGTQRRSWRQKIKQHPFIIVGIVVAIFALIVFTLAVSKFGWGWTGFTGGESNITITNTSKGITIAKELQPAKALWDWLELLAALAIPVVVGFGAAWFTRTQHLRDQEREKQREDLLQVYLDRISELLLHDRLRQSKPGDEVRNVARVRTTTVLTQLDTRRIGYVFAFLREADLMSTTSNNSVVSLENADLRTVKWERVNLSKARLSETDLRSADLSETNLRSVVIGITSEELEKQAKSLQGATMPDGSKHP